LQLEAFALFKQGSIDEKVGGNSQKRLPVNASISVEQSGRYHQFRLTQAANFC
jgi:hypothetical protein